MTDPRAPMPTATDRLHERIRELEAERDQLEEWYRESVSDLNELTVTLTRWREDYSRTCEERDRLREAIAEAYDWCAHKEDTQMCEEVLRAALETADD